jgi:pyruvate kinase
MEFRKTKIMCTLGNKTCTVPSIIKLLEAGMNVARIAMPQLRAEIENR